MLIQLACHGAPHNSTLDLSMTNEIYALVLAGIISGGILGGSIRTATETKARRGAPPWLPFGHTSVLRIAFGQIVNLFVVAVLMTGAALLILRAAGISGLNGQRAQIFGVNWFIGAAVAKTLRYMYWRRKV